jgi:regulator of sigma E protease
VIAFADVRKTIDAQAKGAAFALELERVQADGSRANVKLTAAVGPYHEYLLGFGIQRAEHVYRVAGFVPAIQEGWKASWRFLQEGWLMLKRIMNRQISSENVGGIITIGVVSHHFAESGIVALLFFLCTLSMNLAFLNVLPIPVLDGGHLFFLLVEKLKGSPVSDRVMGYSQMVGIVLILSLMVYVTYNDVMRWIF